MPTETGSADAAAALRAVVTPRRNAAHRSPKISEVIAQQLAKYIADAKLPDGARLPNERELVEIFGVGRTTLREGLRLLETRGVLTIRPGPNGGPVVRRPKPADLSEALTLILQLNDASFGDVIEARRAIEPTIARLAAARVTDAEVEELQQSVERLLAEVDDGEVFLAENAVFHAAIARIARNLPLEAFLGSLKTIADGAAFGLQYSARRRQAIGEAHARIVDAMRARDPERAEAEMREHLDEAAEYWRTKYADVLRADVQWAQ